ncbi:MAG TPA: GMC oxidoreductase [Dongiaceae bacterium]|nr:GMC oxidoreductase [Dongiaceae bacterium]
MSEHDDKSGKKNGMKRRSFLERMLATSAMASIPGLSTLSNNAEAAWSAEQYAKEQYGDEMEAVVIGSGFGGAITSCRLSKKWPGKVLIAERGKRYGRGDFARGAAILTKGFWNQSEEDVPRLVPAPKGRGLLDLRSYDHMDILLAASWGGGSLLYANALIEPNSPYYDADWPAAIQYDQVKPYYDVISTVMGARSIPTGPESERAMTERLNTSALIANAEGINKHPLPIAVFFGNDFNNPTPMGQEEVNAYGAVQGSCTYCAECVLGCNVGAKNTLDYNYLYVAENKYNAVVKTEHRVDKIVPLTVAGNESRSADGRYGYNVYMVDLVAKKTLVVKTKRVIVAAGTLGSTEILLRNKHLHFSLSRISSKLGKGFSGNGDFFNFELLPDQPAGSDDGPTIVEYLDYQAEQNAHPQGFIAEPMSLPLKTVVELLEVIRPTGPIGELLERLSGLVADKFLMYLTIGRDNSDGSMNLHWLSNGLRLDWPYQNSLTLFNRMIDAAKRAGTAIGARLGFPLPTWARPLRRNLTVHPLGGCHLADSESTGVVSARRGELGRVFNYQNLYVADGSVIPSAIGVNPSITIGAIAEMIAEDITGIVPTAQL